MTMWKVFALLVLLSAPISAGQIPVNLDFEQGQTGQAPPGWTVPSDEPGFSAQVSSEKPESGKASGVLVADDTVLDIQKAGNLIQSVDAAPYRGKRIRFRAASRAELTSPGGRARIWIGLDRPGSPNNGRWDYTSVTIVTPDWNRYEALGEVPEDTRRLNLGLVLVGGGRAWIDSASIEILGSAGEGDEPARALAGRGLDNLVAFTRLLGYVRFFHPSDQAAAADWDKVAIAGAQVAEKAGSPEELARALETFFLPVAPTVRVFSTGRKPALPPELAPPADGPLEVTVWNHFGVGLAKQGSAYQSKRVTLGSSREPGRLGQYIDAAPLKGKPVRVRATVRADGPGARLALKTFSKGQQDSSPLAEKEIPPTAGAWRVEELTATVPEEAEIVALGVELQLASGERVSWDDVTLEAVGEAPPAQPLLDNTGFENAGADGAPAGWALDPESKRGGYTVVLSADGAKSGQSLVLSYQKPELESPAKPFVADLGGGVSAMIPLALYKDAQGTLPHVPEMVRTAAPAKPEGFLPSGNDRSTRLADVALAWNVFQHFYPYFDVVEADWPAELRRALSSAATDKDAVAFLATLRRLVAALHDGHGGVFHPSNRAFHQLPLAWDWVEERLVITRADPEKAPGASRGDVVAAIDGKPAGEALAAREELISGATAQWKRFRSLQDLLAGVENEEVRLALQTPSGETKTVTVRRSLSFQENPEGFEEPRPEKIAEIRPGIFYVDLARVTEEEFKAAVDRLAGAKGIVFDVRGYPTGSALLAFPHLIDAPIYTARWQIPEVTRPDREGMTFSFSNWPVEPAAPRFPAKVAFVTDGRAISYAETCLGMIESYKVAPIVGAPTAGTNGNVNPFVLPGGYRVSWTGMKVSKQDGSQHHGVGILPTHPVSRTLKGVAEGRDEFLEKAIEVVSH